MSSLPNTILSLIIGFCVLKLPTAFAAKCIGIEGACNARLDQITLVGAHNSGAGFNGVLYYHNPYLPAISCAYRNQYTDATTMLNIGIRYFDLDTCYEDRNGYETGAWLCHKDAYGGSLKKFLKEVDDWLRKPKNRGEIIVLHFNRDYDKGDSDRTGLDISKQLKKLWNPYQKNGDPNKVYMQNDIDAKIGNSIWENKRIYVFIHSQLLKTPRESFYFHQDDIGYTWTSMGFVGSNNCKALATTVSDKCPYQSSRKFVRLDLYLSWGLCVNDLASYCNYYTKYAADRCYKKIKKDGVKYRTVNFIVLDDVMNKDARDAIKIAKRISEKHLAGKI